MRFFLPSNPAGRLEYILVSIVIGAAIYGANLALINLRIDIDARQANFNRAELGVFLVIAFVLYALAIINMLRRINDTGRSTGIIVLAFIPVVNLLFAVWLILAGPEHTASYAPFGDNPYDPDAWVKTPDPKADSGPVVSYQGQELLLPGEQGWDRDNQSDAA